MKSNYFRRKASAQAAIEFSFVLPIFLLLLIGLFNLGNIVFQYALLSTGCREAARYGAAIGYVDENTLRYYDCDEIRERAIAVMGYANNDTTTIIIRYDGGPGGGTKYNSCEDLAALNGSDNIITGDRINVIINSEIHPWEYPFGSESGTMNLEATSSKLIIKELTLD